MPRWRWSLEQRNKAQLAMERAQVDHRQPRRQGAVRRRCLGQGESRRAGGFFYGQTLPEYRQGDTTFAGRAIADVIESGKMEVRAKIDETDRDNLQSGQTASRRIDALPGQTFNATVGALSGLASRGNFFETTAVRQFDVTFDLRSSPTRASRPAPRCGW